MAANQAPRPWDSPGKNTEVGCHFLLQCMKVKSGSQVAQLCPTLHGPMDCSLLGSSTHRIFQARVLEWGAIAFSNSIPKERQCKECSNYNTSALTSHDSTLMLKILQAIFQPYVNHELPDIPAGFRKGRGTRDQMANICWIIKKAREFQKNVYFCFIDYVKAFTVWITINCGKIWKRWEYQTTWPASWEICVQVKNQQNRTWNSALVPNQERSTSRLYIVTLLI